MPGDSRHVYTSVSTTSGEQAKLPAGNTDTTVQQQVVELAVLVQTLPAVVDVYGWDDHQRDLQLVSYLDKTAMNVAQELGDDELYDYDIIVKLV